MTCVGVVRQRRYFLVVLWQRQPDRGFPSEQSPVLPQFPVMPVSEHPWAAPRAPCPEPPGIGVVCLCVGGGRPRVTRCFVLIQKSATLACLSVCRFTVALVWGDLRRF